ncbi:hypothetical protein HDU96_002666 [Phlyctochytrium bullatum]|nr:hypothetical protein HDU96_002666 [Phlyctochytrium bullatum]
MFSFVRSIFSDGSSPGRDHHGHHSKDRRANADGHTPHFSASSSSKDTHLHHSASETFSSRHHHSHAPALAPRLSYPHLTALGGSTDTGDTLHPPISSSHYHRKHRLFRDCHDELASVCSQPPASPTLAASPAPLIGGAPAAVPVATPVFSEGPDSPASSKQPIPPSVTSILTGTPSSNPTNATAIPILLSPPPGDLGHPASSPTRGPLSTTSTASSSYATAVSSAPSPTTSSSTVTWVPLKPDGGAQPVPPGPGTRRLSLTIAAAAAAANLGIVLGGGSAGGTRGSTDAGQLGQSGGARTPRANSMLELILDQVEAGPVKAPMAYWHEFKRFVIQTRVIDTGIGVIVGRSFQEVVRSFVNDLFVPPIAAMFGDRVVNKFLVLRRGRTKGKSYKTVEEALADGAITLNYGRFVHQSINFLIVGLSVYWFLRVLKNFFEWRIDTHDRRPCPKCLSEIPKKAERCAFCAYDVPPAIEDGDQLDAIASTDSLAVPSPLVAKKKD